jgi:Caspase domain
MHERRLALLVGTNEYTDTGFAQLRAPAGDVAALAKVLGDPAIGGFDVRASLVNRGKDEVEYKLEEFFSEAEPTDLLVLYLSCHGVLAEDGRLYFATRNTERKRLRATGVSDWFIHEVMTQSRAQRSVLILDCCHSGAFAKGLARKGDAELNVANRFEGRGQITLTASTKLEFAFEGPELNLVSGQARGSIFTSALIEGLSTGDADQDGDGQVTVDELYDFVYLRVKAATPSQTPGKSGDVRGGITIARSIAGPRPDRKPAAASAHETQPSQIFENVWYRPEGTRVEDMIKMKAMTDRGTLELRPDHLSFKGKWTSLDITDVERVSRARSGKDFVNSFVVVEYGGGQIAQFADGRNLGWSGFLGGNRKLQSAIERFASH